MAILVDDDSCDMITISIASVLVRCQGRTLHRVAASGLPFSDMCGTRSGIYMTSRVMIVYIYKAKSNCNWSMEIANGAGDDQVS